MSEKIYDTFFSVDGIHLYLVNDHDYEDLEAEVAVFRWMSQDRLVRGKWIYGPDHLFFVPPLSYQEIADTLTDLRGTA